MPKPVQAPSVANTEILMSTVVVLQAGLKMAKSIADDGRLSDEKGPFFRHNCRTAAVGEEKCSLVWRRAKTEVV